MGLILKSSFKTNRMISNQTETDFNDLHETPFIENEHIAFIPGKSLFPCDNNDPFKLNRKDY